MPFPIPPDKSTGCLLQTTRHGEICPLFGERIKIIPQQEWGQFIGQMDLRPRVEEVFDQNGVGSCAAESRTQALQVSLDWAGRPYEQLSPWFLYYHTSGGVDQGSTLSDNLQYARDHGIAPMRLHPRSSGWKRRPSEEAYAEAKQYKLDEFYEITSIQEVGTALILEMPVVFGWNGHSCMLTSLVDEQTVEYCNSWGDWGDAGFGKLRLSEINFGYGCYADRSPKDPSS